MTTENNEKNWCQMRETVLLVNVAVARIEHAMTEGDDSFTSLSQSFVDIVDSAKQITEPTTQLEDVLSGMPIEKALEVAIEKTTIEDIEFF